MWCEGRWLLRYIRTDDSAAERRAVRDALRGLEEGEMAATHLRCTVHSGRTIERQLLVKAPISRGHLRAALYCRCTEADRDELV